jgi:hypothetical protein
MGSVRQVWLWFRSQGLAFPLQSTTLAEIQWVTPSYTAIHSILTNPVYAGAYTYGKTRCERYVDPQGRLCKRIRRLPRSQWAVLIEDHHEGFIDWDTYLMNQKRISQNTRPRPHQASGALREGSALLQALATCGNCGRRLRVYYQGRQSTPGYYCAGNHITNGRARYCLRVGGLRIDKAVSRAFLETAAPAGMQAALEAEKDFAAEHRAAVVQWKLQVEQARYQAERAERRYRSVEPENRLVAGTLETEWEQRLADLAAAEAELDRRQRSCPVALTEQQRQRIRALGSDLTRAWEAATTTDRDRKELLRSLLEEVNISVDRTEQQAHLILRWKGGLISEADVNLWHPRQPAIRTDEDTIALVRRLAQHYSDAIIAGVLNRQGRQTATGLRFTANRVGNLRRHWQIPCFRPAENANAGEPVTVQKAAEIFGVVPSTIHRWLVDGVIAGEQITPGAPWRIRITEELRQRFVDETPPGYVPMQEATRLLGISRQTVLQRVKQGQLAAVHVRRGKRKGLRIRVLEAQPALFTEPS